MQGANFAVERRASRSRRAASCRAQRRQHGLGLRRQRGRRRGRARRSAGSARRGEPRESIEPASGRRSARRSTRSRSRRRGRRTSRRARWTDENAEAAGDRERRAAMLRRATCDREGDHEAEKATGATSVCRTSARMKVPTRRGTRRPRRSRTPAKVRGSDGSRSRRRRRGRRGGRSRNRDGAPMAWSLDHQRTRPPNNPMSIRPSRRMGEWADVPATGAGRRGDAWRPDLASDQRCRAGSRRRDPGTARRFSSEVQYRSRGSNEGRGAAPTPSRSLENAEPEPVAGRGLSRRRGRETRARELGELAHPNRSF